MPQLPPVAAAAFVIALLAAITIATVVMQMRARRRRTLLAELVRASAPVPRPSVSRAEVPIDPVPSPPSSLRGHNYQRAEREGRFLAFDERAASREGAPGRPGRRLAARIAYAAPVASPPPAAVPLPPLAVAPEVVLPAPAREVLTALPSDRHAASSHTPPQAEAGSTGAGLSLSHGGLRSVSDEWDGLPSSEVALQAPMAVRSVTSETASEALLTQRSPVAGERRDVEERDVEERDSEQEEMPAPVPASSGRAEPEADEAWAVPSAEAEPGETRALDEVGVGLDEPEVTREEPQAALDGPVTLGDTPSMAHPDEMRDEPGAALEEVEAPPAPSARPREPQVTVLAARASLPALSPLPALMTREITLGDAARVLRGLTMTDGRQLRRAVAVGAATSVVAAAFAIRGRRRR